MPAVADPPKPAAPAPPPSPSPAPAPAPSPAPTAPPSDDPFSKVDSALFAPAPDPKPAPSPAPGTPPKGTPDPKAAEPKPAPAPAPGPKQLREELDRVKGELTSKSTALTSLEAKIKDYEAKGKDTTALANRAAELEKQITERDATIRVLKQEMSPEFIEKYVKPFDQHAEDAKIEVEALQVGQWTTDEATGTRTWTPARQATWKDFSAIYALPYAEAKGRAKELFGEESSLVMDHYNALHRLNREKGRALESEKANAAKRQEEEQAKRAQMEAGFNGACDQAQKDFENKFPDFYTAPAGDKEAEDMLSEGWKIVDYKPKTFQEAVLVRTRIRMNAASAPMLMLLNRRLKAELAEAKEKLDKKIKGGPGGTKTPASGGGGAPDDQDDSPEAWKALARETLSGS